MIGAVLAGAASVVGADVFRGIFQKDKQAPVSIEKHEPYETFAPIKTFAPQIEQVYAPQMDYSVIIESPGAKITSKKDQTIRQQQEADITPTVEIEDIGMGAAKGTDLSKLAIIGAVALIGYGLVRR